MRRALTISFLACVTFSCTSESNGINSKTGTTIWAFFLTKPALFSYGLLAGVAGGLVLGSRKKTSIKSANGSQPADPELENRYFDVESRLKKTEYENQLLKRQLAEVEQFSITASIQKEKNIQARSDFFDQPQKPQSWIQEMRTLYYLQPGTDNRFKETSKVNTITEALYTLTYQNNNPAEADLKFIDTPDNVFLAVQNEPTWILVACERSNIPTEYTTSIRTDIPGKAILKNGEWEILQKAKITYV